MRLNDSLVVVTGASSGIGAATATTLGAAGARVVLVARRAQALDDLVRDLRADGHSAWAFAADLGHSDGAAGLQSFVLEELGVPDAIINNAGAGRFLRIEETSPEEAVEMMEAPYFATFFTTRAFIEPMLARGTGNVLMVNSPVSLMPWPGAVGYAAARYAVRGFTEALRQDLRGTGLHVSSVTPTRVDSTYFTANEGAAERIPKAEILFGATTASTVADGIVKALRHDDRDVYLPRRWALAQPMVRALPSPVAWLTAITGDRRERS